MLGELPRLRSGPSIYEFVVARLDGEGRLTEAGVELPDADRMRNPRWVAGGMDGTISHHGGSGAFTSADDAAKPARLVVKAARKPSTRNLRKAYDALCGEDALSLVDGLGSALVALEPDRYEVRTLGRWLATTGTDRGAVKAGIALIGMTYAGDVDGDADPADVALFHALGAHDEFTLFSVVALSNSVSDPAPELVALARKVHGWGRIHCVEWLAQTDDPAIKAWILREGYRNAVDNYMLAYTAATAGSLLDALRGPAADADPAARAAAITDDEADLVLDRAVLTAAGDILASLIGGGPAEDIDDYEAAPDTVGAYLTHMRARAETADDFVAVATIHGWLANEEGWDWRIEQSDWTAERRAAGQAACDEILGRPEVTDRIAAALLSDDADEFRRADSFARLRNLDTFDRHVQWIKREPCEVRGLWWYRAWVQAAGNPDRSEQLAELARTLLPLDKIVGPLVDEDGFGSGWEPHRALDWTLQALDVHPGVGGDLVLVGLQCSVTRNRLMALRALQAWPQVTWPAGAEQLVTHLAAADPYESARQRATDALTPTP